MWVLGGFSVTERKYVCLPDLGASRIKSGKHNFLSKAQMCLILTCVRIKTKEKEKIQQKRKKWGWSDFNSGTRLYSIFAVLDKKTDSKKSVKKWASQLGHSGLFWAHFCNPKKADFDEKRRFWPSWEADFWTPFGPRFLSKIKANTLREPRNGF